MCDQRPTEREVVAPAPGDGLRPPESAASKSAWPASGPLSASEIAEFLTAQGLDFALVRHAASSSSEQSLIARRAAVGRDVVGAKALVLRAKFRQESEIALAIVRGSDRLSSAALRRALKLSTSSAVSVSFATSTEIHQHLRGLEPGRVPPLGPPLLPSVRHVLVDVGLLSEPEVGFNAAEFESSVIMRTAEFRKTLPTSALVLALVEQAPTTDIDSAVNRRH